MADANFCQDMFRDHFRQESYNHYTVFSVWLLP